MFGSVYKYSRFLCTDGVSNLISHQCGGYEPTIALYTVELRSLNSAEEAKHTETVYYDNVRSE